MSLSTNTVKELPLNIEASGFVKAGVWLIVLSVGGFFLWSSFAPLAKGVNSAGQVIVEGNNKVVQHPVGGIVEKILVREGQQVKAGQTLIKMNSINSQSQFNRLHLQQQNLIAIEARLKAERDEKTSISPPEFLENTPQNRENLSLQQQLMENRQQSLRLEDNALHKAKIGLEASLKGLNNSIKNKIQQKASLKAQHKRYKKLVDQGFMPKDELINIERIQMQMESDIAKGFGEMGQLENRILSLSLQKLKLKQDYQKDIRQQLTQVSEQISNISEQLQAAKLALENELILAPTAGTLIDIQIFTEGGVIPAGKELMRIVPEGAPLMVRAKLPIQYVDKVKKGSSVDLRFSAFNQDTTPKLVGEVELISADRLVDTITGMPYYDMNVKISDTEMARLGELKIRPGMPVEVFVHLGERSLLTDLLKPIVDRTKTGLTEL